MFFPGAAAAAEKQSGILKKPPYGALPPMAGALDAHEKEKWLEENAERLSRDGRERVHSAALSEFVRGASPFHCGLLK